MRDQVAMIRALEELGHKPGNPIPPKTFHKARMRIRTIEEKFTDAGKMLVTKAEQSVGRGKVPEEIAQQNITQCRKNECGAYELLDNGEDACIKCQCKGTGLKAKARSRHFACPAGYFDNTKIVILTVTTKRHA